MQILTLWTMELQGADRGTQTQTKGTNPTKMRVRCAPLRTCRLVLKTVGKHRCITEFRKAQGADQGTNLKACARAVHTIQDL